MRCPKCDGDTQVRNSREAEGGVRRRRECVKCKARVTTFERVVEVRTPEQEKKLAEAKMVQRYADANRRKVEARRRVEDLQRGDDCEVNNL